MTRPDHSGARIGRRGGPGRRLLAAVTVLPVAVLLAVAGCAHAPVHFVHPDVDFGFIRRAAIFPFQNLSTDRFAAVRLHSVFLAELLQHEGLEIVDPGETLAAASELRLNPEIPLTQDEVVALGKRLGVDAVFSGTVEEYGIERLSSDRTYAVTATFSLAETETGVMIWQAQVEADGSSFWRKLFGGGSASLYDVSREAVRKALETLFG